MSANLLSPGTAITQAIRRASESYNRLDQTALHSIRGTSHAQQLQRRNSANAALLQLRSLEAARERMLELTAAADALSVAAQTSGGTAGTDPGLIAAIDRYAAARAALGVL